MSSLNMKDLTVSFINKGEESNLKIKSRDLLSNLIALLAKIDEDIESNYNPIITRPDYSSNLKVKLPQSVSRFVSINTDVVALPSREDRTYLDIVQPKFSMDFYPEDKDIEDFFYGITYQLLRCLGIESQLQDLEIIFALKDYEQKGGLPNSLGSFICFPTPKIIIHNKFGENPVNEFEFKVSENFKKRYSQLGLVEMIVSCAHELYHARQFFHFPKFYRDTSRVNPNFDYQGYRNTRIERGARLFAIKFLAIIVELVKAKADSGVALTRCESWVLAEGDYMVEKMIKEESGLTEDSDISWSEFIGAINLSNENIGKYGTKDIKPILY